MSSVAQAAATAALSDHGFLSMCRSANEAGRKQLVEGMEALGFATIGGQANFVLSMVGDGGTFSEARQQRGIIVRPLAPYGMAEFVRITIGTVTENERLLEATREIAQNSEISAQL